MKGKQLGILVVLIAIIVGMAMYAFVGFGSGENGVSSMASQMKLGLDIKGGVYVVYSVETEATGEEKAMLVSQTIEVLRRRIDSMGLTEPNIYAEGDSRIRVELPGVTDSAEALNVIGKTAKLSFAQVKNGMTVSSGEKFDESKMVELFKGDGIKDAQGVMLQNPPKNVVSLKLNPEAAEIFAKATGESVNFRSEYGNGQIAILLDDVVISAPQVNTQILNGESVIEGNFSYESARELALLIKSGALPVNLIEERSSLKGPTLGQGAFELSVKAALIGIILVMIYMIFMYKLPGVLASIALVLYTSIIVVLMVLMKATLTLPGILGVVLSIGMAVDANVIIFEKLREELEEGKSLKAAVAHAFSKALSAIVDSNVTTLIAAIVLFNFGEGPIKGFAVTLMLGILTSMFTAIFITRTLLVQFSTSKSFSNKKLYTASFHVKKHFDFMKKKKLWFSISGLVVLAGLALFIVTGFNYGIDFSGGTAIQIQLNEKVNAAEVSEVLAPSGVKFEISFEGENLEQLQLMTKTPLDNEKRQEIFAMLQEKYKLDDSAMLMSDQFGPRVGSEIQGKAAEAILLAAVGMLIYIAVRFELKFSVAAILALIHDILVLLAIYAIFRIPVNSSFIAAILTVVGYSINDTIVIFDRIRGEEKYSKTSNPVKIVNTSLNSTLTRSINTSITTLLVVVVLLVLGVDTIKELSLPLLLGIAVGTYSSVFIASPIWAFFKNRGQMKSKA